MRSSGDLLLACSAQIAIAQLRKSLGMPYLGLCLITDKAIRDRFVKCLEEVCTHHTQTRVAEAVGTRQTYLAALKKAKNPKIPTLLVAKFCSIYHYSPHYILIGKGDKRSGLAPEEKKDVYYLRIIEQLLAALLELKGSWSDATGELVGEAMKKRQ